MRLRPLVVAAAAAGLVVVVASAPLARLSAGEPSKGAAKTETRAGHPHFNDGGTLSWSKTLAEAQAAAKSSGKLIFVEYGRKACGNCKAVCETVLPDPSIRDRLSKLVVGLAAECDPPAREEAVGKMLSENLKGAGTLPFVGFFTEDLKWVGGFAGYKDVAGFDEVLKAVEKSPLLDASPENRKKLDALAAQAELGVEKQTWLKVFQAAKSAGEITGRAPSRDRIAAAVAKAREFGESELAKALESLTTGGDRAAARTSLRKLASSFSGEPEGREADAGARAVERLGVLEGVPADKLPAAREKALKDFAGTRWTALFSGEPAEKAPAAEAPAEPAK